MYAAICVQQVVNMHMQIRPSSSVTNCVWSIFTVRERDITVRQKHMQDDVCRACSITGATGAGMPSQRHGMSVLLIKQSVIHNQLQRLW